MNFPRPLRKISEQVDSVAAATQVVSNQLVAVTRMGMVAFILISIVAVTALILTVSR